MESDEFSPYLFFNRLMGLWWLVALAAFLGGIFGLVFSQLHPPIYEATATLVVTIDLDRFALRDINEDMLQYNEDLALNTTKAILLLPELRNDVLAELNRQGVSVTTEQLIKDYTIERKHDIWELRFRNEDPAIAQTVANIWIDLGYRIMLARHQSGEIPDYLVFQPPSPAGLPADPVVYDRNRLIFAGITFGFISGIVATSLISRPVRKPVPEVG
jgi:uncharacterized protein involved in exopolysaccharide biosynthesis